MKQDGKFFIADQRYYLTADRERVVTHGDPAAAFLYANTGARIPIEFARKHGLVKEKAAKKSPNKAAPKSANKSKK